MKYKYILVSCTKSSGIDIINRTYLDEGWEVVDSVSQHMSGTGSGIFPEGGMVIFTLRKEIHQ